MIPAREIDEWTLREWELLEGYAIEGNAFLSPNFILPALKHLTPDSNPWVMLVERQDESFPRLVGVGVFEEQATSTLMPLPHLKSYQCILSFFDGLLVEESCAPAVLDAIFQWMAKNSDRWHGLSFRSRSLNSKLDRELTEAANRNGVVWHLDAEHERPMISLNDLPHDVLTDLYSRSRRKTIKRNWRRLERHGDVEFRVGTDASESAARIEKFLQLESAGWKSDEGTALALIEREKDFFSEMVGQFSQRSHAVFGELVVAGQVVGSSINLISGSTGFAFKIGREAEFAAASPGTLTDFALLKSCKREFADLTAFDSCAKPGSYLEGIWPWRLQVGSGLFATSHRGKAFSSTMMHLKRVKRGIAEAMRNV
ncbi:MAG: hypothetical protein CMJ78_13120 [Planctomycetaceae bacterium]|nr:hypothetical protein [Planctomycetaceae bacterium]